MHSAYLSELRKKFRSVFNMDNMKDNLSCPICLDYCRNAVECAECHNLFCKECSSSLKVCPLCRKVTFFNDSHFARRMIEGLPAKCRFCRLDTTIGNLQRHLDLCEKAIIKCPYCHLDIEKMKIMDHFAIKHKKEYLEKLNKCIQLFTETENSQISTSSSYKDDILVKRFQIFGSNGKHYCKGALDACPVACQCCFRTCAPNGCNCAECMKLDLKSRNLPKGWLVNPEGCAAQKLMNGIFYCGRTLGVLCSPFTGINCHACRVLDIHAAPGGRYFNLV